MRDRIRLEGMGGFLCPPKHPMHTSCVADKHGGYMSLDAGVAAEWLDPAIRAECKRKLEEWSANRPAIDSPEVVAWIRQVLGYFKGCYRNEEAGEKQWHASDLIIDRKRDPMFAPEEHAGVNLIRRYYPEYQPSAEDFASAKWGS